MGAGVGGVPVAVTPGAPGVSNPAYFSSVR
jgi:hypothetical protein